MQPKGVVKRSAFLRLFPNLVLNFVKETEEVSYLVEFFFEAGGKEGFCFKILFDYIILFHRQIKFNILEKTFIAHGGFPM